MKATQFSLYIIIPLLLFTTSSCKKWVTVDPPVDRLTTETVFASDESANAAIRGFYSDAVATLNYAAYGALTLYPALSADELENTQVSATYDPFRTNALDAQNATISSAIWYKSYYHIYVSNLIIQKAAQSPGLSASVSRQLQGESLFWRAYFHFYLYNLFGPVPLITSPDYLTNSSMVRNDSATVYEQIIQDLSTAKNLLTTAYPTAEKVRVNKWSAAALLARVYLYSGQWSAAEVEAKEVIESGTYQMTTLGTAFSANNSEAILQLYAPPSSPFATAEGNTFNTSSPSIRPNFMLSEALLQSFETGDGRRSVWINANTVGSTTYSYPYKYKIRTAPTGSPKGEYSTLLRLAEIYLIRAEARALQQNLPGAIEDLNQVRNRAGLIAATASDQTSLLHAIAMERQHELFVEWGHRWLDLKRTGVAHAVLSAVKGSSWQSTDLLYPIPQSEILLNPRLTQNPGY